MTKSSLIAFFILANSLIYSAPLQAQPNTEVFITDLSYKGETIGFTSPVNVSKNDGYDNQPSFYNDNVLLFSSTRQGQTDIAQSLYNKSKTSWLTNTPDGSEYSPLKIPNKRAFSAIRLDKDGLQRLYKYPLETGTPELLLKELKVGYHVWLSDELLVCTVLVEKGMDLVVVNFKDQTRYTFQKKVGRSLLKIPNSNLISFVALESGKAVLKSMDPVSGTTKKLAMLPPGVQDLCWLPNGMVVVGKDNSLWGMQPGIDQDWKLVKRFENPEIGNISRLAVNTIGSKMAFVSESTVVAPVQAQLDAYNARDIEAFLLPFSEDVKVYSYPNKILYEGREIMRVQYESFFENNPDLKCEIKNRIVIGNRVIDEELVTVNKAQISAVAIYEVENGKITRVTFIQ